MIKKNVLSIATLSLVWCCSSFSMDYGNKRPLQTSDGKTVLCDVKLCKLSTTITHVMEDLEDSSTAIPLPKVPKNTWDLLCPLLKNMSEGNRDGILDKLAEYQIVQLVHVLCAAEYLDIRTPDDEIILTDFVAEAIARELLTEDSKKKFLAAENFSEVFNAVPENLEQMILKKIMEVNPGFKSRILQDCRIPFKVLKGHPDLIWSVGFNHSGDKIISACSAVEIRIWNEKSALCERIFKRPITGVVSVDINRTGDKIIFSDDEVRIYDVQIGACEQVFKWSIGAFNSSGDKAVIISDGTVRIWNLKNEKWEQVFSGSFYGVRSVAFNDAGDKIVLACCDQTIKILDVKSSACERVLSGHKDGVYSAAFNHIGDKIISASKDHTARMWDVKSGKCERVLEGHLKDVYSAAFNEAGDKIVSASLDHTVKIWDVKTGQCLHILKGHNLGVASAKFNRMGDKVVSGSWDKTLRVWDLSCDDYLDNKLTLEQALLLACCDDAVRNYKPFDISKQPHLMKIVDSIDNDVIKDIAQRWSSVRWYSYGWQYCVNKINGIFYT